MNEIMIESKENLAPSKPAQFRGLFFQLHHRNIQILKALELYRSDKTTRNKRIIKPYVGCLQWAIYTNLIYSISRCYIFIFCNGVKFQRLNWKLENQVPTRLLSFPCRIPSQKHPTYLNDEVNWYRVKNDKTFYNRIMLDGRNELKYQACFRET